MDINTFIEKNINLINANKWKDLWANAITDFEGYEYELYKLYKMFKDTDIDCNQDLIFQYVRSPKTIKYVEPSGAFLTNEDISHELNAELFQFRKEYNIKDINNLNDIRNYHMDYANTSSNTFKTADRLSLSFYYNVEYSEVCISIAIRQDPNQNVFKRIAFKHLSPITVVFVPGLGFAYSRDDIIDIRNHFEKLLKNSEIIQ